MPSKTTPRLIPRFAYSHVQTDGKLQNTLEALEQIDSRSVCLNLTNSAFDPPALSRPTVRDRLARIKTVIAKLRRHSITVDLALPALLNRCLTSPAYKRYLLSLCPEAAKTGTRTIWLDEPGAARPDDHTQKTHTSPSSKQTLIKLARSIGRRTRQSQANIRIGLIADSKHSTAATAHELAAALAGPKQPLLAQTQSFAQDYHRTEILRSALTAAASAATAPTPMTELLGTIDNPDASLFQKGVEATQMQINLNLLFGLNHMFLNCFDQVGTAPGTENPYLQMYRNHRPFMRSLAKLLPSPPQHHGVRVVIPDKAPAYPSKTKNNRSACPEPTAWPILFWRLGIPVCLAPVKTIAHTHDDTVYVLTGDVPRMLNRRQLNYIFRQGVLLDAFAASALQEMGLSDLIGLNVAGLIANVETEIFSDPTFAAPHYGHRTVITPYLKPAHFRQLRPTRAHVRPITTLVRKNHLPNTNGIMLFDDLARRHRCAVLPYGSAAAQSVALLGTARQRHFRDILAWLLRQRLTCYVENCPDLAPFYIPHPQRRRILLALLNVGFDWAIQSRIRLSHIPFAVKRIRSLDENGKLIRSRQLRLTTVRDDYYLELTDDTAVLPMQMTILLIEG